MRFYGFALLAGAAVLGACGGEKKSATDSAAAAAATTSTATPATATATPSATPATPATAGAAPAAAPAGGAAAPAPITGKTHEVKMYGDAKGYRFEPAALTIKSGDGVKYVLVDGGPHNVAFQNVDPAVKAQLDANMPGQHMGELSGPMVMQPNESYTVSFGKIPAGKYDYICTPHAALNMKGTITVQ
jgi:plastocyanin